MRRRDNGRKATTNRAFLAGSAQRRSAGSRQQRVARTLDRPSGSKPESPANAERARRERDARTEDVSHCETSFCRVRSSIGRKRAGAATHPAGSRPATPGQPAGSGRRERAAISEARRRAARLARAANSWLGCRRNTPRSSRARRDPPAAAGAPAAPAAAPRAFTPRQLAHRVRQPQRAAGGAGSGGGSALLGGAALALRRHGLHIDRGLGADGSALHSWRTLTGLRRSGARDGGIAEKLDRTISSSAMCRSRWAQNVPADSATWVHDVKRGRDRSGGGGQRQCRCKPQCARGARWVVCARLPSAAPSNATAPQANKMRDG